MSVLYVRQRCHGMWKLEKALKDKSMAETEYKCTETENSEIVGHFFTKFVSEEKAQLTNL